jgi:hypothetical protein
MDKIAEQLYLDFYRATPTLSDASTLQRFGTFHDSLRAPIHRWFKYPAGYSYK